MTRKSLTDKLRERRAQASGDQAPTPAKKKATAKKKTAVTKPVSKKTPAKKAIPVAKKEAAPDAPLPSPTEGITTLAPTGPLSDRFGKDRIGAVALADGRCAIVDRHWGGDVAAFVWPVEYVFDLPVIGMTVCKLIYHRGDNAVYLRGGEEGKNVLPHVSPEVAVGAVVGRLVGYLETEK